MAGLWNALQWGHNERDGVLIVCSNVGSDGDQRKRQSSASLAIWWRHHGMQLQHIPTTCAWFCCAWFCWDKLLQFIYICSLGVICWPCDNGLIDYCPKDSWVTLKCMGKLTGAKHPQKNRFSHEYKPRIKHTCTHDSWFIFMWLTFWSECMLTWTIFSRPRWPLIMFSACACISTFVNVWR